MTDQEKVIAALSECNPFNQCYEERCPYYKDNNCLESLHEDVLKLLKEPEPKHTQWVHEPDRTNHWHCSGCGYVTGLAGLMGNFCPNCGAKVQKKTEEELLKEVSGVWMPALSFSQYVATAGK